jgi:hypothetical protein
MIKPSGHVRTLRSSLIFHHLDKRFKGFLRRCVRAGLGWRKGEEWDVRTRTVCDHSWTSNQRL